MAPVASPSKFSKMRQNSSHLDEFSSPHAAQPNPKRQSTASAFLPKDPPRIVGTPDYMSPEMLDGKGLDLPTIDFWALGVILFELIIGIPPFNDTTVEQVFSNIRNNRIPWGELVTEDGQEVLSSEARALIEGLLEPDPYQRLGADSIEDIKSHSFFEGRPSSAGVDWETIRDSDPPFLPDVNQDMSVFEKETAKWRRELLGDRQAPRKSSGGIDKELNTNKSDIKFLRKDILFLENSAASKRKKKDIMDGTVRRFSILLSPNDFPKPK